ncbi:uncharacterized protein [Gossypium hirsutum]|uniref:Uncharacterized protein n=1 Tax=Gossypium hirsutum TaxID=3635 RepID=A0ABM3BD58_GOSHI|nr:uncharacterized protein LOC121225111 [Gossypium hirsutum]
MATEAVPEGVPVVDTPCHSSNTGEDVHSQGLGSFCIPAVHYFSKHDTIKLAAYNFLLWKHKFLLILEGYGLDGFILGHSDGITLLEGHMHEGLYRFQFSKSASATVSSSLKPSSSLLNSAQLSSSSL